MTETTRPRRKIWVAAFTVFVASGVVLAVGGVVLGSQLKSPEQAAADAQPPAASLVTAKVEKRTLSDALLVRGTVAPGKAKVLLPPAALSGDAAVVTKVLSRSGAELAEGTVILEVRGEPLYPLITPFPLYRDITDGMSGPDVHEVQHALSRMGYGAPRTGRFDSGTQAALARFYSDRGYPVPTGEGEPSGGGGAPAGSVANDDDETDGNGAAEAKPTPRLKLSHVIALDRAGRNISAVPVMVGARLSTDTAILKLDAGASTIKATVSADQVSVVAKGAQAVIEDEVREATAIAKVSSVGTEPEETATGTGYAVRLKFTGKSLAPTPNHTVRITIGESTEPEPVLAVPVTAIFTESDGTSHVTVADPDASPAGPATFDIDVRVGDSAGGWVAVEPVDEGAELAEGADVVVGWSNADAIPPTSETP